MTCILGGPTAFLDGAWPDRVAAIQDRVPRRILDDTLYIQRCGLRHLVAGTTMQNEWAVPPPAELFIEMRIANAISEIARVASLVDSFAARHNFPNNVVVALNVSLDEILNSIISYAYEGARQHDIAVRLEPRPARYFHAPSAVRDHSGRCRVALRAQPDGPAGICPPRRPLSFRALE
jgi:hypothetical protein